MPEFVYALHDFVAEHEDEIPFRAGERIEVIEKDDEFGDGWWQGRNLAGKTGLFPQNYTTPQPPYPQSQSNLSQFASAPNDASTSNVGAGGSSSQMAATMGDVQKALDQLGAGHRLTSGDTDRTSMSFASGTDDESEADNDAAGGSWGNRQLLAEKARRELAERQMRELEAANIPPPIPLAMSDDSESEGEPDHGDDEGEKGVNGFASQRTSVQQPRTPTVPTFGGSSKPEGTRPLGTHSRQGSAAASKSSLPIPQPASLPPNLTITNPDEQWEEPSPVVPDTAATITARSVEAERTPAEMEPTPKIGGPETETPRLAGAEVPLPSSPPPPPQPEPVKSILSAIVPAVGPPPGSVLTSMPPPAEPQESKPTPSPTPALGPPFLESPAASNSGYPSETLYAAPAAAPAPAPTPAPAAAPPAPSKADPATHNLPADPNTWSTEDVISWLTSKGFDSSVRDRFEEQDITGDVLLSLDLALLKDELGITAFGKRMRLNNAISDLRKSIAPPQAANSTPAQVQGNPVNGQGIPHGLVLSPESAPQTNELSPAEWGTGASAANLKTEEPETVGPLVGLGLASLNNRERSSVSSAPISDGTGSMRGKRSTVGSVDPSSIAEEDETRAETDTTDADKTSMTTLSKQPFPARSIGSRSSHEPGPTETEATSVAGSLKQSQPKDTPPSSIPPSPSKRGSVDSPTSATASIKRSGSANGLKSKGKQEKEKDGRLSFFGGSLGKSRKPPPRYSAEGLPDSSPQAPPQPEKRSLSRYLGGSTHRKTASGQSNIRISSGASGTATPNISSPVPASTSPTTSQTNSGTPGSPNILRKRLSSSPGPNEMRNGTESNEPITENTENALQKIGKPDHQGWMRKKGERYNSWKNRYFVLKGVHLYYLRSQNESKIKGYINVSGYKVIADENTNVGRYGFRIVHDTEKPHYFSSDEQVVIREWMKAIMKATIGRDYSKPVISSCNIPTIPLNVAQAMSPAPRPPSPHARDATQRALRPSNPDKLSDRDAAVLMLAVKGQERPGDEKLRSRVESVFTVASADNQDFQEARIAEPASPLPPRPNRDARQPKAKPLSAHHQQLLDWVNTHLPPSTPKATDLSQSFASGLILFRLVEKLSGKIQGVPDALFMAPIDSEDSFEGLFKLFDIMLENGISTGDVSMSEVHTGDEKGIVRLVESVKAWSETR